MLVECCRYIMVECPTCDEIKEYELNYFEFASKGYLELKCQCDDLNIRLIRLDRYRLLMHIHCASCKKVHIYNMKIESLFENNNSLSCLNGEKICIVGKKDFLDKIKGKKDKNSVIGTDRLALLMKKLYTLDEANNIVCGCGNKNLSARIFSNKVNLSCSECKETQTIKIESEEDLRVLLEKDKIVIGRQKVSFK